MPRISTPDQPSAATAAGNNSTSTSRPTLCLPSSAAPASPAEPARQKTWLIFGATGHIGRSLTHTALSHGDNVAAVGRRGESTPAQMQSGSDKRFHGLLCDVRVRESVEQVVKKALERFPGGLDVVVNCTGYGVLASCEDQDAADVRAQFDTNFFGTLHIIQTTLPVFRAQNNVAAAASAHHQPDSDSNGTPPVRGGRYLIFSSTSGALGVPGLGPYCATKYAVEGLIESMAYEIDAFGIKATLVEPGHIRLPRSYCGRASKHPPSLADRSSAQTSGDDPHVPPSTLKKNKEDDGDEDEDEKRAETDQRQQDNHLLPGPSSSSSSSEPPPLQCYGHFLLKPPPPTSAYNTLTSPSRHAERVITWLSDRQPTSADKSAELVWQLGHCRFPPLRLLLGGFAIDSVRERLRGITEEIEEWKFLNFPSLPGPGPGPAPAPASASSSSRPDGTEAGKIEDDNQALLDGGPGAGPEEEYDAMMMMELADEDGDADGTVMMMEEEEEEDD